MRGVYTVSVDIASVSAIKTVLTLQSPADAVTEIIAASITNRSNDANEQLEADLVHITTLGTVASTSVTAADIAKHEQGDPDSSVVCASNYTDEPDTYENLPIDKQGFSNLAGYRYDPMPEERPIISPSQYVGLRLSAAPATAFDLTAEITFREIGG